MKWPGATNIKIHVLISIIIYFHPVVLATNWSHVVTEIGLTSHPNWNLLPHDICGQTAFNETTQSETTSSANINRFPWIVFLFNTHKSRKENSPKCGGVIINKNYVLTTAHCCGRITVEESRVRIGGFNTSHKNSECTSQGCANPVKDLRIEEILKYSSSHSSYYQDHICLIKLKQRITFNDHVRPICLPIYNNIIQSIHEGDKLTFAGFRESGSKLLQKSWPIIPDKDCNIFYPRTQNEKFCLGFTSLKDDLGKNGCYSNAGNAAMKSYLVEGTTKTYAIGLYARFNILHYLICDMELPKLFTNVLEYNQWVLDNLKI